MAKTNWQDPKTSEMRSTHVAGLMEAVGKIEDSIGMESVFETNIPLTEVFNSSDDRYRIFQAPEGKRNWTAEQAPVIKRNGTVISSGFEVDYGGGAIILNVNDTVENTYTADVKYTKTTEIDVSADINAHNTSGTAHDDIRESINSLGAEVDEHLAEKVHQGEIHGFRLTEGKLEYFDGAEWQRVKGDGYPVGNVADFTAQVGNGEVTLKWQDPSDVTITDSNGTVITIARWAGTKLLRKTGTFPVNENDGTLVIDNTVKNQYQTNGLVDTGLVNGTTYYYMLFPYTDEDVVTIDAANRVSATPQAYDDLTGSPGSPYLISGTMEEGFFGEVPSSELITGDALASECGISQGTSQHSTAGWLKFAYKGEILFVAKKPIRKSISWDAINTAKCVYGDSGDKTVVINGLTYKVTLMRALEPLNDPKTVASEGSGAVNHHSEWNRLMCQIHEEAINGSWGYPNNIESDIGILEHSLGSGSQGMYSDADLIVTSGDGRLSWCQEMSISTSNRLYRGYNGVSGSGNGVSSGAGSGYGWRPVLRLIS
jgi:hypothetical protein